MKSNDIKALHQLELSELLAKLETLHQELFAAQMSNTARKLANTTSIKMMKKDIARIKTVVGEKTAN